MVPRWLRIPSLSCFLYLYAWTFHVVFQEPVRRQTLKKKQHSFKNKKYITNLQHCVGSPNYQWKNKKKTITYSSNFQNKRKMKSMLNRESNCKWRKKPNSVINRILKRDNMFDNCVPYHAIYAGCRIEKLIWSINSVAQWSESARLSHERVWIVDIGFEMCDSYFEFL